MNRDYLFQPKHIPWNIGTGGCKKGHDLSLYVPMPSGVYVCLGCKRENSAQYRKQNRETLNLKNRVGRYKISVEAYQNMYELQGGRCSICNVKLIMPRLRIDHDHKTGETRGLLCVSCNTGIGLLKESPDILRNAAKYLEKCDA